MQALLVSLMRKDPPYWIGIKDAKGSISIVHCWGLGPGRSTRRRRNNTAPRRVGRYFCSELLKEWVRPWGDRQKHSYHQDKNGQGVQLRPIDELAEAKVPIHAPKASWPLMVALD